MAYLDGGGALVGDGPDEERGADEVVVVAGEEGRVGGKLGPEGAHGRLARALTLKEQGVPVVEERVAGVEGVADQRQRGLVEEPRLAPLRVDVGVGPVGNDKWF